MSADRFTQASLSQEKKPVCEFDVNFCISYVNYTSASKHVDSQLLLTLEADEKRKTLAFFDPDFKDVDKNLVSARGLVIKHCMSSNRIEVEDRDGCVFFSAKVYRNITPTA